MGLQRLILYCIVWYCVTLSGIALNSGRYLGGGMVFSCVSLHCRILYYFVWHCITLSGIVFHFGGIVLNSVSLYCMVLPLPDRPDQPTMCDIVLHVGVYCTEL